MNLGQAIRDLRKSKKIKLKDLAESSGISKTALRNIEKDKSFPSKNTIDMICHSLGVDQGVLMFFCISEDSVPEDKREAFNVLVEPLRKMLCQ